MFLAVTYTAVEGTDHPVAEGKVIPAEVGMIVANFQAEEPRAQVHPSVAKTA